MMEAKVETIKGVGAKTAEALHKAGIFTLGDLYYYLPRTYESYQATSRIADIRPGKVIIKGKLSDLHTSKTRRRGLTITEGIIRDKSDAIRVVWFNQPYRAKAMNEREEYYFSGEYAFKNGRYQLTSPSVELASIVDRAGESKFQPVYPARGALGSRFFAKLFSSLRASFAQIPDLLPPSSPYAAPGARRQALFHAHFPENSREAKRAREILSYEELFELVLAGELNKSEIHQLKARPCPFVAAHTQALVRSLPFELTSAQRRATWEILQDLEKSTPMNRLLQGDVGSGKTVVAAIAAYQAIRAGHQVALLAPTAILAAQHAEGLHQILAPLGVQVALLTGATKHKKELKQQISADQAQLIIGTHALLTDDTRFHSLALVIIDEQHRFGVAQRQKLLMKTGDSDSSLALAPHLLSMTATPIPRSLQLAVFGDLDISTLNELPQGRQPILTRILPEITLALDLYPAIHQAIAAEEQVYWICKAIEDNPSSETASVKKQADKLKKLFPEAEVAFLHGRMKPSEKDDIMGQFAAGAIDILVSTTVVEVGVNVPNATQMVIMDAEGYGLAQLHQLRGRVGRGQKASACYLITSGEEPPSRRLRELEKSTDGFHLAEVDLKLRGPGEIYGSLQHGALNLRIASLDNSQLLLAASRDAKSFARELAKSPDIMLKYRELQNTISRYQQLTTLN